MSSKTSDNQIRLTIYTVTIIAFLIAIFHETWLNNYHISKAEKCFANQKFICAYNHYQKAFNSGFNNEQYVKNYFQTLFKMKKTAVIQEELNNLLVNYPNNIAYDDIIDIFEKLQKNVEEDYGDTYINIAVQGTNIVHWNHTEPINVFINAPSGIPPYYITEVEKSFTEYQRILNNKIKFQYVSNENDADIEIIFTDNVSGGKCKDENCKKVLGFTENTISGSMLNKSIVKLRTKDTDNTEFTANQIHNIAKHEIGHALGINGHSFNEDDVMYPMSNDTEWAKDYRTRLIKRKDFSNRDINTLKLLYNIIPDVTNKYYETVKHTDMYMPVAVLGTKEEISQNKLKEANLYINNVTNNFIAQMSLAESYVSNRDFDKAKEEFEKALLSAQTNEEKFTVNHNLAVVYYQEQDYKTALSYAQIANSLSDDLENKNSNEIQAYCYMDLKDYKKAEPILENLVKVNPENSTISSSLTYCYLKQLKFFKAFDEIKRIKKHNPNAFEEPAYQQLKWVKFIA